MVMMTEPSNSSSICCQSTPLKSSALINNNILTASIGWRSRATGLASDLRSKGRRFISSLPVRRRACVATTEKFSTDPCAPITDQHNIGPDEWMSTLCGWEGNRRPAVALAMCFRLQWSNHLRTSGVKRKRALYLHFTRSTPLVTFLPIPSYIE